MNGTELINWISASVAPLILVAARLGGLSVFAPVLGSQVVGNKVKVFLFLGLSVATVPVLLSTGRLAGIGCISSRKVSAPAAVGSSSQR